MEKKWSERMNENNKNNQDEFTEEFELTAAEKKALEELRKDLMPGDSLEERVVGALYERSLLMKLHRHMTKFTIWRSLAAAAACLVLLATGFLVGQWSAFHRASGFDSSSRTDIDFSVAASVQQTGSAYLIALQRLANIPDAKDSDAVIQGQEVALTSLCTAAEKVSHLVPKDILSDQLLASLDSGTSSRKSGDGILIDHNQIIEF
jgi:hypothetical protein